MLDDQDIQPSFSCFALGAPMFEYGLVYAL
jgi:hypothetical protein